jgi:hypothetical protein
MEGAYIYKESKRGEGRNYMFLLFEMSCFADRKG